VRTKDKTGYGRLWIEEEFILTLDLYYRTKSQERNDKNPKVKKIAEFTNRTPASIVYRLGNYSAIDPNTKAKGFDNGGKTVKEMFENYSSDMIRLRQLSESILKRYKGGLKFDNEGIKAFVTNFEANSDLYNERLKECENLHSEFLKRWPLKDLSKILTLENYVIGKQNYDSFCYWVERKTRSLGSILGATADKFKVYYDKDGSKYRWIKRFNSSQAAFKATKREILNILKAAEDGNLEAIKDNELFRDSNLFRGKLLYLYFPDKFLNIFSEEDINFFLVRLGIPFERNEHVINKQNRLVALKGSDPIMSAWSARKFGYFLYSQFIPPSRTLSKNFYKKDKPKSGLAEVLQEEGSYALPDVRQTEVELIDLDSIKVKITKGKRKGKKVKRKPNYIAENIRNMKLGAQGEEIVLKLEKESLSRAGRKDLANKVKRISLEDDSAGYDIHSYFINGKNKFIDVKSTTTGINRNAPFYLTQNEKEVMEYVKGRYFLYRVFSANTKTPKLLVIDHKTFKDRFIIKEKLWEVFLSE